MKTVREFRSCSGRARSTVLVCFLTCICVTAFVAPTEADVFTLLDDNSEVGIDTESSDGVFSWLVDGVDHLYQQWFWYRVGSGVAEASIDTLPIGVEGTTDTDLDGDDDTLFVSFLGAGFEIEVRYILDGGSAGSGASDLAEQISIVNTSGGAIDMHFFQYSDFDLDEDADGDTVVFTNANAVAQSNGATAMTETVVTPVSSHHEGGIYPDTLDKLEDGFVDDLDDTPGIGVPLGPDDVTWAYQWDVSIPSGGTFQISKDKNLIAIPEPSTLLLVLLGLTIIAARTRLSRR